MKKIYLHKQSHCLFVFLFIGIISVISTCGLSAAVTEDFPPSDFWVVDHTKLEYTKDGNIQYNPKGIVGYYYKYGNEYQLTDTINLMTIAMWNKKKIDMNQDGEFNFKLFFDTGKFSSVNNVNNSASKKFISDGICFVLHNKGATQDLIGGTIYNIGYGHIYPSFAIEFDTEYNGNRYNFEGGDSIGSSHHISYLKNGSMRALPGTYKPMQTNGAYVGGGDGFNVKIVGRKVYANNTTYYDLLTYMEERDTDTTSVEKHGPLLLRDSMRFNKLSDVVAGLEVDENCQALVTGGITSATCAAANRHAVRFTRLTTAEPSPAVTAVILANCGSIFDPRLINIQSESENKSYDTILGSKDCYNVVGHPLIRDTIEYTISCEKLQCNNEYILAFNDIPHGSICKYYINNELKDSIIYDTTESYNIGYNLLYREYFRNDSAANVKVIIDSVEYNFRIFNDDNTIDGADELSQEIDIQGDENIRVGTLDIDTNSLAQTIQLPNLPGCTNKLQRYILSSETANFVTKPTIDSNTNVLTFELKPNVCSDRIDINLQCECKKTFTLIINNTSYSSSCDAITFTEISRKNSNGVPKPPPSSWNLVDFEPCCPATQLYIGYTATTTSPCAKIRTIFTNELASSHDDVAVEVVRNSSKDEFYVKLSGDVRDTIYKRYEVCASLTNGTMCCDTFEFDGYFNGKKMMDFKATVEMGTLRAEVDLVGLAERPFIPTSTGHGGVGGSLTGNSAGTTIADLPIKITLHDFFGTQIAVLVDETMMGTSKVVYYNIHSLDPGQYNVVFHLGGYVETIGIIKGGQ